MFYIFCSNFEGFCMTNMDYADYGSDSNSKFTRKNPKRRGNSKVA